MKMFAKIVKYWSEVICIAFVLFASSLSTELSNSTLYSMSGQFRTFTTIPNIEHDTYIRTGDLNIGGFIMATYSGVKTSCSKLYRKGSISIEVAEAVAFAVELVNENPDLLPNISLGFVLLNDCSNTNIALAKALQFLPQMTYNQECKCCSLHVKESNDALSFGSDMMTQYDVIGVISSMLSSISVALSQLFSTSKIPLIGCVATSDELSDKSDHPFFLRVTAPDRFQVEAMLEFIKNNGWTYISILYAYGSYGEKGYEHFKLLAASYNICIATHHKVNELTDFDYIANDLLENPTARVVILFIYLNEVRNLFYAINRQNARGTFIWIGGDGLGSSFRSDFKGYEEDLIGAFVFSYYKTFVPELYDYIGRLRTNTSTNPWLKPVWENLFTCSFREGTCGLDSSITDSSDFAYSKTSSLYIDAVMVFAHAATQLLSDVCPGVPGREARACIRGDDLLEYMRNISFRGYSEHIEFDGNGDAKGKYEIQQIGMGFKNVQKGKFTSLYGLKPRTIAMYNISTKQIAYTGETVLWDHLVTMARVVPFVANVTQLLNVPESVCSRPCLSREYKIQKELQCCWDCRKCRDNERLINENTNCQECNMFTWPNPDTAFTSCREIVVTLPSMSDPISIILTSVSVMATALTVGIWIGYVLHRDSFVIKAASKGISFFQMLAVVIGYITVILLQMPPTDTICGAVYFMFCLSFAWLYSPLVVKAVRVYRIFLISSKFHRKPACVSWPSQLVMVTILISVQVVLCLGTYIIFTPAARKTQPVLTEQFVELACDMTLPGMVSFLVYNLVLVFLCSVVAFKTRKLPDNFNESWFIFMCVVTTLTIWLGFVPTYFTASRQFVKTLMLSVALLLNHSVALIFLFIPKIYAAVCSTSETKSVIRFQLQTSRIAIIPNRVAPTPDGHFRSNLQFTMKD